MTLFHGLPSDRVHGIAQTEHGVMWFATDGGLASYNGRRTHAVIAEGLPSGRVLAIRVDQSGALWIGTDNGAARLANGKFDPIPETAGKVITAIITPERDHAILSSESGQIFDCQVKQESLSRSRPGEGATGLTFTVRAIPDEPLQSADRDQPGPLKITSLALVGETLYAGTQSRGLLLIENGEAREVLSKPRSYFVNALETDSRGRLWAGVRARGDASGLFNISDPLRPARTNASTGAVTAITRGGNGDIWVATDGEGAFHLEDGKLIERLTFEGTGGALRSDHIFGVFIDAEEVIWFATDKGVCRYDPHSMRTENISDNPSSNYVRALWRTSRGRLLAGTNSGLYAHDSNQTWVAISELGRRIIYALGEDQTGRVVVATASGLFTSPPNGSTFSRIPPPTDRPQGDSVRAVTTVNDVTYIATYGYGVERLQGSQRTLIWPPSTADNRLREVTALGSDTANRLVIGTASAGAFFFDGHQVGTETALEKLKGGAVWTIAVDGSVMWLGTERGLYLFQGGQLKEVVSGVNARSVVVVPDELPNSQVWCATVGKGLLKVVLDDQFGAIVSRLDVEQGLPSQRVFAVLSERAENKLENLIAGTNRGLVRYEPGHVVPTVLPARIISQRIHQQEELASGLNLDYPQNSLLLDVTAISSRTFPEQFQYAFTLSDSAGKIIRQKISPDSQFAMEQLNPGAYQVIARAFTKDLTPSTPLQFSFSVARAPFPWTSTALAVLLTLALLALLWAILERRRIVKTSAALVEANQELADARLNLANEAERERRRIARDLHDQTLADLRHLLLLADQFSNNQILTAKKSDAANLRSEIESISQEVRRICEDLSPSVLQNVGFAAALEFALSHAVQQCGPEKQLASEFVCDDALEERTRLAPSVQMQIYRIAQEALNNVCRHANATTLRMVVTASERGDFELTIEDNGREFDPVKGDQHEGRGLANMRARASLIEAQISWGIRETGGTVFTLRRARDGAQNAILGKPG